MKKAGEELFTYLGYNDLIIVSGYIVKCKKKHQSQSFVLLLFISLDIEGAFLLVSKHTKKRNLHIEK